MAIFNRKEEIQMMKLIGANQSFIRGPFIIESIIYGFIAALIASGLGVWALYGAAKTLKSYQISIDPTIHFVDKYIILVVVCMIVVGALIGIISSMFATKRYLKV
jgi:cell division transport system permease protein